MKRTATALAAVTVAGAIGMSIASAGGPASKAPSSKNEPVLDPAHFVTVIDNPYYPLPVGRQLVYRGTRDGVTQVDKVTVTSDTKVIEGITTTVVSDVARHAGTLLEKTFDWFAQDDLGNVWYLGEDTKAYDPDGTIDTSGSWEAGVNGAEPGIIMEANPRVPDAYRQEYLKGQAEDTAWVVDRGRSLTVPYRRMHNVLRTLEFARIEPKVVDEKYYAPGIGIVLEKALAGDQEVAKLVKVIDRGSGG